MEISKVSLERHLSELRWVVQELRCVLPALNNNKAVASSVGECIERIDFAIFNLGRNAAKLTKKKEKEKNNV